MQVNNTLTKNGLFVLVAIYAFTALISTAVSYIVESFGLILLLLSYKNWRDWRQKDKWLFIGLAAYASAFFLTSITAIDKGLAFETMKGQFEPITLLFMVLAVAWDKRKIKIVIALVALGLFINDLYAFYQWIFLAHDRPPGFVKSSAVLFAECIALLLPMCYLLFLHSKQKKVVFASALLLILTGILMIANSVKMVWIVTTLALCIITLGAILLRTAQSAFRRMLIVPVLLCTMAAVFLFSPIVQERVATMTSAPSSYMHQRMVLWDLGKRIFNDHPLLGVGPGNYGPEKFRYFDLHYPGEEIDRKIINSHNIVVQTASEQGVTGLIALLVLFGGIFATSLRLMRMNSAVFGLGIFVLTASLLLTGMAEYTIGYKPLMRLYWLLLGLLVVAARVGTPDVGLKGAYWRE